MRRARRAKRARASASKGDNTLRSSEASRAPPAITPLSVILSPPSRQTDLSPGICVLKSLVQFVVVRDLVATSAVLLCH